MDKEVVVHLYTMEYYPAIKRNTFGSVLIRWMNLEPIIQSEVSQKEKDKYHIQVKYRKMVLKNLFSGQQWETDIEKILTHVWEREEGVRCMERVTWKLTSPYVKQMANRNLL